MKLLTTLVLVMTAGLSFAQDKDLKKLVGEKQIECCSSCPPENHNSCNQGDRGRVDKTKVRAATSNKGGSGGAKKE